MGLAYFGEFEHGSGDGFLDRCCYGLLFEEVFGDDDEAFCRFAEPTVDLDD